MAGKILIIQNIEREGPGIIQEVLADHRIPYEIHLAQNHSSWPGIQQFSGVIILGGPDSANDPTDKIRRQIKLIQDVSQRSVPYMGICLGMQLLVKAVGGQVLSCPTKEVGFRDVNGRLFRVHLTSTAKAHPLFQGIPHSLPIFHLHGETVELPPGGIVLGYGEQCPVQLVQWGESAFGIQGHLEITESMLLRWLAEDPDLQPLNHTRLLKDYHQLEDELRRIGYQFFSNFLNLVVQNG